MIRCLLLNVTAGMPRIEVLGDRSLLSPLRKSIAGVVNKLRIVSMTLQPGEDASARC